ncbi:unnamed protein product [Lymnaea stagnalis]|uniref:J domain-containing protein n=1 Tax=Lymnaea stagnalis TaxID=6523 RepID=A0AAV2HGZ2_LYMST
MEDNEDPLGKISRQLSELASVPGHGNEPQRDSVQWTPFSGISPQPGSVPFRNLYTWNPMDLPDFEPLSPPEVSSPVEPNRPFHSGSPGPIRHDSFINKNQFDWISDARNQGYPVITDGSGGSPSFSPQRYTYLGQSNLPSLEQVFQYDSIGASPNVRLPRQLSHPSSPAQYIGSDRSGRFLESSPSSMNILPHNLLSENVLPEVLSHNSDQEERNFGMPQKRMSSPLFDPSTPPPIFPVQRHHIEKSASLSHVAPNEGIVDHLRLNSTPNISLDFGLKIGRDSHYSNIENITPEREDETIHDLARTKWNSFDSTIIPNLDNINKNLSHSQSSEPQSEAAVQDCSKPSYSDIAKTPKFGKPEQATVDSSKGQASKQVRKDGKPVGPAVKRTSSGSKFWPKSPPPPGDAEHPKVVSNSRYGLDNFDDHLLSPGSNSSSSESLAQVPRSRRGSGSSAGSSTCALDDHPPSPNSHASFSETEVLCQGQKLTVGAKGKKDQGPSENLFFDPRRIFQTKPTKSKAQPQSKTKDTQNETGKSLNETILNNGKPTASNTSLKLPSSARQHDYINNDLRDASKLTNQISAESCQGNTGKPEDMIKQKESRPAKRSSGGRTNGVYRRERRKSPDNGHIESEDLHDDTHHQQGRASLLTEHFDKEKIEEWCSQAWEKASHWGNICITSLLNSLIYLLGIILYITSAGVSLFMLLLVKAWAWIKIKLFKGQSDQKEGNNWNARDHLRRRVGLEENINLPSTGEEAMKRLLACKGKDPYSILGLRADATDEDIKKYYRKQAVLVHPDKNQEPGAEEAFKILGHAFEMIGDASKRKQYDSHTQETNEAEAMREFAEMLSKLQTKIQEAANIMRCDNCTGKHQRFPVDRPFYSARFCQRCNIFHAAKEGDVWAESTMLGFRWHYFALMESQVFDITEWMACHKEYFKNMKANAHAVMYRIATDGSKRSKRQQSGEPSLEDFINRLFNKSASAAGDSHSSSWAPPHSGGDDSNWTHGGAGSAAAAAAAAAKQKGRRNKKKRH